ncbi:MAG: hypothetical protein K6B28_05510 [Lachnospiraceae bacterium]|nr:hypothetical protein [Lachnospiraceae bacterium]
MDRLLELLKDGHARTTLMLASELNTTVTDIGRKLEYLENMGIIKKVSLEEPSCVESCTGCSGCGPRESGKSSKCEGCMPDKEILNMGEMWEVVHHG